MNFDEQTPAFKALAVKNRSRGLCGCGRALAANAPSSQARRYCVACYPAVRRRLKVANKAKKKHPHHCKRCGVRFVGEVPPHRTCERCRAWELQRQARRSQRPGCRCGALIDDGRRQCEPCRLADNARRRVNRASQKAPEDAAAAARRKAGLCECGKPRAKGRTECKECRDRRSAQRRADAKAAGMCARCLKAPSLQGLSWCAACSSASKERYTTRRAEGLCTHCATRRAVPGETRCEPCREVHRRNLANRWVKEKTNQWVNTH